MVRVAAAGKLDFSEFDPWDPWWWRRLDWMLDELETTQARDVSQLRHNHWVTLASRSTLPPEAFDTAQTHATTAMNRFMVATWPWRADEIGEAGTKTDRESITQAHHERFGRPGEARYDNMVQEVGRALSHKLTSAEKHRDRQRRRQRWQQRVVQGRSAHG